MRIVIETNDALKETGHRDQGCPACALSRADSTQSPRTVAEVLNKNRASQDRSDSSQLQVVAYFLQSIFENSSYQKIMSQVALPASQMNIIHSFVKEHSPK